MRSYAQFPLGGSPIHIFEAHQKWNKLFEAKH